MAHLGSLFGDPSCLGIPLNEVLYREVEYQLSHRRRPRLIEEQDKFGIRRTSAVNRDHKAFSVGRAKNGLGSSFAQQAIQGLIRANLVHVWA